MSEKLKSGDHVEWSSLRGKSAGTVKKKITSDKEIKGHTVRASKDSPQYEVASDATGKRAAHKPDSMKKIKKK